MTNRERIEVLVFISERSELLKGFVFSEVLVFISERSELLKGVRGKAPTVCRLYLILGNYLTLGLSNKYG